MATEARRYLQLGGVAPEAAVSLCQSMGVEVDQFGVSDITVRYRS